jgi:hypothetical protein
MRIRIDGCPKHEKSKGDKSADEFVFHEKKKIVESETTAVPEGLTTRAMNE